MTREEVFNVLSMEREYQKEKWDDIEEKNQPKDFVKYMKQYMAHVSSALKMGKTEEAMSQLRKVTALGVAALEMHGAPSR